MTGEMRALGLCLVVLLSGCATIFSGRDEAITFKSVPDGASFVVTDRNGHQINSGTTPSTLNLKRGAGYFKPQSYHVVINMPGYESKTVTVASGMNGWYFCNILLGGLIGMVIVDPITGAMYKLEPKEANVTLDPQHAAVIRDGVRTLTIVLAQDLPESVLAQAVPISQ